MLWKGRRQSSNVEDRRGMGSGMRFPGGGYGGGFGGGRMRGGGLGIGGIIILFVIAWALGINPLALLSGDLGGGGYVEQESMSGGSSSSPQQEQLKQFVSVVLADTEDTWHQLLPQVGAQYREPKLVLFSGGAQSACGFAQSAVGPFYCPGDEKVYLDLDFFDELSRRFGAPGDFAEAYVIAHEVGHHVQNVLGIEGQVAKVRAGLSETEANALSV
ncbi:MAG TPA: neutral zinc metallopeptidase, partial [Dongiaceae bacterium]|nr:neutral zinc metallopeptidase [Dongiaceae bacterium]